VSKYKPLPWCERGDSNPHGVTHWNLNPIADNDLAESREKRVPNDLKVPRIIGVFWEMPVVALVGLVAQCVAARVARRAVGLVSAPLEWLP